MVVHDSVTFFVTRIGDLLGLSKALDHPGWTQLMLPNGEAFRHISSVHPNPGIHKVR